MRHPTTLAIYRCIFEFVFVQQYIWVPFINNNVFYQSNTLSNNSCAASTTSAVLAFISQFSLLGGELWFFVISWDLRLAYTNPFSSYKQNRRYYTILVLSIALISSFALIFWGPTQYGVATEGYTIFWSILLAFEFISYIFNTEKIAKILSTGVAYGFSFRGVWSLAIILYTNRSELSWDTMSPFRSKHQRKLVEKVVNEGLLLKPHLNSALRSEVLYFTTQGIMYAARECDRHNVEKMSSNEDSNQFGISELSNNEGTRDFSFIERLSHVIKIDNTSKKVVSMPFFQDEATTRETFSNIAKITELQQQQITKDKSHDFELEAESLGLLDSLDDNEEFTKDNNVIESKDPNLSNGNYYNNDLESNIDSNKNQSKDGLDNHDSINDSSNSNITIENNKDKPEIISTNTIKSAKHLTLTKEVLNDFKKKSIKNPLELSNRGSTSNSITESVETTKWRDTMDIEFQFSNGTPDRKQKSTSFDSNISTWQRIRGKRGNNQSIDSNDNRSSTSSSSAHSNKSLSKVVVTALSRAKEIYFIVMGNVFPTTTLSERYDLKGSWVNRHRIAIKHKINKNGKQKRMKDIENSAPLLFDNDVRQKIVLLPTVANSLAEQIRRDVTFLRDQGLMDYSLLVGVKRQRFEVIKESNSGASNSSFMTSITNSLELENPFQRKKDGGISASIVEGPGTFYFGIIDVLQEWNYSKKLERYFKLFILRLEGDGLSAIAPDLYAARFYEGAVLDFLEGIENNTNHFVSNRRKPYRRSYVITSPLHNSDLERDTNTTTISKIDINYSVSKPSMNSMNVEVDVQRNTVRLLHNEL
eukprot:gene19416-25292_t